MKETTENQVLGTQIEIEQSPPDPCQEQRGITFAIAIGN